jgi:hypothetical protein
VYGQRRASKLHDTSCSARCVGPIQDTWEHGHLEASVEAFALLPGTEASPQGGPPCGAARIFSFDSLGDRGDDRTNSALGLRPEVFRPTRWRTRRVAWSGEFPLRWNAIAMRRRRTGLAAGRTPARRPPRRRRSRRLYAVQIVFMRSSRHLKALQNAESRSTRQLVIAWHRSFSRRDGARYECVAVRAWHRGARRPG